MRGLAIITRTLSVPQVADRAGRLWQYHSRSDQHSKVACWAVLFDLLQSFAARSNGSMRGSTGGCTIKL